MQETTVQKQEQILSRTFKMTQSASSTAGLHLVPTVNSELCFPFVHTLWLTLILHLFFHHTYRCVLVFTQICVVLVHFIGR